MTQNQAAVSVLIIALVTAALRFLPFIIFKDGKTPESIKKLGKTLPYAVMGMLCVYCLKDVSLKTFSGFVPQLIAVIAVSLSYIWKRNTLLSIALGTAVYMALVQFVFI